MLGIPKQVISRESVYPMGATANASAVAFFWSER
jgi:hypothetical protein